MKIQVLSLSEIQKLLPDRDPFTHKGDYGRILLLCGSRGYTGAAALAAMGALRCGAGLVYLGVPDCIYEIEAVKLTEPVVFPLPSCKGMLDISAWDAIVHRLPDMDAVLIGPGLGCSNGTRDIVHSILKTYPKPVVLDADGINLMRNHMDILRDRTAPTILTPHMGEFARIGGNSELPSDIAAAAMAQEYGVIVLLKGHHTVITDGITTYRNHTGNAGMAVGGCGDVLAGIITGLLGQGVTPLQAAAWGALLHGAAGDLCAQSIGQYGMLPSDMLSVLPRLLK